ncbi:MAG TPA: hypothetical protein VJP80_01220 [Candidatus Saccharimonadales bacterium]|nr:hypothetical protein [Candidatus Saccharimonadales bacterium]
MQQDELYSLISRTSGLMERYERRSQALEQQLGQLTHSLLSVVERWPDVLRQSTDAALNTLPAQVIHSVKGGLDRPVADYQQRLLASATEVSDRMQTLARQVERLEQLHRWAIWKLAGAVGASLALLLAGGLWLGMHYMDVIRDNQVNARLLKAYNAADVTLCANDQLCAHVAPKGPRYGDQQQYQLVAPR